MKILAIDMDIIMTPCVKLYNHMTDGNNLSPTQIWSTFNEMLEIDKYLTYDVNMMHLLHRIILNNPQAHYVPIEYSAGVITDLQNHSQYPEGHFDLEYIGWHHNAGVKHEDLTQIIRNSKYKNSNWIGFLLEKNKLDLYKWYKPANAPQMPISDDNIDRITISKISEIDETTKYNIIYIIQSPQWVPYKYQHLMQFLTDTIDATAYEKQQIIEQ